MRSINLNFAVTLIVKIIVIKYARPAKFTTYPANYVSYTNYDNYDSYSLEPTINSDCIPSEQLEYLNDNIESVEIFKRDKNAIRCWKCKKNNVENSFTCECGVDLSINSHSITSVIVHK